MKNIFLSMILSMFTPLVGAMHIVEGEGGTDSEPTAEEKALFGKIDKKMAEYIKSLELDNIKESFVTEKIAELKESVTTMIEDTKSNGFEKALEDYKAEMKSQMNEVGLQITKVGEEATGTEKGKSMKSIIKEALEGKDMTDYRENPVGKSPSMALDLKAVIDVTGFVGAVITPERFGPEASFQGPKKFDIRMAMATGSSDTDSIDHIKETALVNNSGFLAENAGSAESDVNFEQVTTVSKRIATHINVSKRSLRNVSFLTSHLTNRFSELIAEVATDSVINGTGVGNTFDGFFNNATIFTAGSLAAKVDEANNADVIGAAIARLAEITNLEATAIFMNPLDVYLLTVTKDLQGSYSENSVIVSRIDGNLFINGVRVWSTFHVAADKYLVCDLSATSTELLETQGLSMQIADQHATNAVENQVTFIFEMEAILPIYKDFAFLKGTLSTDAVLLETI